MIGDWFDHINAFLHAHPYWIGQLMFLLRVKCGLLAALMGYFLYRVYKEKPPSAQAKKPPATEYFVA
jgi:hypothetical protein